MTVRFRDRTKVGDSSPLKSGIKPLDTALSGLELGDLVLLEGDVSSSRLAHLLCVKSQLPRAEGGLTSPAIWLDGGNAFDPYCIAEFSRALGLDPERALKRILLSRAFTIHQMSTLLRTRLWEGVKKFGSKFVVVSDLASLYAESDMPVEEAERMFIQGIEALSISPKRKALIILITSSGPDNKELRRLNEILASRANIVLRTRQQRNRVRVDIEKNRSEEPMRIVVVPDLKGTVRLDDFVKA